MYVFIFLVKVTEWPPIGKIAAYSAYEMFSWYKYLIVRFFFFFLFFFSPRFLEWESFLIVPFPDLCLLVPFYILLTFLYFINFKPTVFILRQNDYKQRYYLDKWMKFTQ